MIYNFKIGDKVKFLKSNDFGTIVNITSVIIEEDPITDNPNEIKQGVYAGLEVGLT